MSNQKLKSVLNFYHFFYKFSSFTEKTYIINESNNQFRSSRSFTHQSIFQGN
jgi:hypothetical protein